MIARLRRLLDTKQLSAVELAKWYLERIERFDGELGCYLYVNAEGALKAAARAQRCIDHGEAAPLTGIPIALKDNLCTMDMPTTCASKMLGGYTPPYDAAAVARLREQGAVLLGKLNMDEFGMGATTATSHYKKTTNPYDPARVPGGSSGGSAAAVASGLCAAALGTDTGGSIRQPAAFCGVSGFRPSYGRVSRYGVVALASSLDQVGPLARSAQDCAALLGAIAGVDARDMTTQRIDLGAFTADAPPQKKKIAVVEELMGGDIDGETRAAVERATDWYRGAGWQVERVSLPLLKHAVAAYYLISSAEAASNLARFDGVRFGFCEDGASYREQLERTRATGFGREVKRRILLGTYALGEAECADCYATAQKLVSLLAAQYDEVFESYDALLSPVSPAAAYRFDAAPDDPAGAYAADVCTVGAALAGLPAISTPCGYDKDGLPIGLMITANRFADSAALSLAAAFEREFARREPACWGAL